jgi:hypothetical protein
MIAVLILMLLALSIYRFLSVNLEAIAIASETVAEQDEMTALFSYLQMELNNIPPRGQGLLIGTAYRFNGVSKDEMQWISGPGSGVLTEAADGQFRTTLMLKARAKESNIVDLGLRRRPVTGSDEDVNWVTLLPDVAELEIRYFDPRLNAKIERWTDQATRPLLVYVTIRKTKGSVPRTAVMTLASSLVQQ